MGINMEKTQILHIVKFLMHVLKKTHNLFFKQIIKIW